MTTMYYRPFRSLCIFALALSLLSIVAMSVSADDDSIPDEQEMELASEFAPYLYLHPDEKFYPVSPIFALSRSNLNSTDNGGTLISTEPTLDMLDDYTDPTTGIYLDNREGTINDDDIEKDFLAHKSEFSPTIHARVTLGPSDEYIIQYWLFYPFNDGPLNRHEGDWEMISVFLDDTTAPQYTAYSQHMAGESAEWGLVDKHGKHPNVYVALGSHANYLRPFEGGLGLAFDEVSDSGRVLAPNDYDIVLLGEKGSGNHPDDQAWLDFAGHWGDYGSGGSGVLGERGPLGPVYFQEGERWDTPVEWTSGLNEASDTWFTLNWIVVNLVFIILAIIAVVLLILIIMKYRLKKKQGTLGPRFFPFLYIDGFNLKSIGLMIGIVALILGIIGIFLPWYTVSVDVESGEYATQGSVDILTIDGYHGLQFNHLDSDYGLVQLFGLPIPFVWILLAGIFIFFLSIIGTQKSRKMGTKFIGRGILTVIPVIIIIVFIVFLMGMTSSFVEDAPPEVTEIIDEISSSPALGETSKSFGDYGQTNLGWGLGIGAFLFIIAMILFIVAGVLEIMARCDFYEVPELEEEVKEEGEAEEKIEPGEEEEVREEEPEEGEAEGKVEPGEEGLPSGEEIPEDELPPPPKKEEVPKEETPAEAETPPEETSKEE